MKMIKNKEIKKKRNQGSLQREKGLKENEQKKRNEKE
jgi:hypothetical protein